MNPQSIVAAGRSHSLVVTSEGRVYQFGDVVDGITATPKISTTPKIINGLPPIVSVAAGSYFSLFVDYDGNAWGLGNSYNGELGTIGHFAEPRQIEFPGAVKLKMASASRNFFSVFLDEDGGVWTTGSNEDGQLGLGNLELNTTPTKIHNLPKICSVSAGYYHTLLLDEHGDVWTCGNNTHGQLGRPTENQMSADFVKMQSPVKFTAVSAGTFHSTFLDIQGRVWGCGHNKNASLALPHTNPVMSVEAWEEKAKIAFISAGFHRCLLIDEEGGVWYAGKKVEELTAINDPHMVSKVDGIPACGVAASCETHHLVVDTEGQVWVWGDNKKGQLGLGHRDFECLPMVNEFLPSIRMLPRTKSSRN